MKCGQAKHGFIISRIAVICALLFSFTVVLSHYLRRDLDFYSSTLSHYAVGEHGIIVELGFYAIAINQLINACLVWPHSPLHKPILPSILLCFASTGAIIVAMFPVQPASADLVTRLPHITGAIMQFALFPVALLFLYRRMARTGIRSFTLLTGITTLVLFLVLLVLYFSAGVPLDSYLGIIEKLDILLITLWLLYFPYTIKGSLDEHATAQ